MKAHKKYLITDMYAVYAYNSTQKWFEQLLEDTVRGSC